MDRMLTSWGRKHYAISLWCKSNRIIIIITVVIKIIEEEEEVEEKKYTKKNKREKYIVNLC